jgi:hypothetical protein
MNYAVRWLPAAEQELAALWLNSARRSSVTQAAHRLDLWKPPGTSAGFLRRSTPSSKTGTRSASGASQPWGGRIGGQSSD